MSNIGEDLRKVLMAGLGAVSVATEKSKEFIEGMSQKGEETAQKSKDVLDDLAQKGEAAWEQGKVFNEELKTKIQNAFDGAKEQVSQLDMDEVAQSLSGMTDDALQAVREKLDELIAHRAEQKNEADCAGQDCPGEEPSAEEPSDGEAPKDGE